MAGVKGRSGGARPGSGPKPKTSLIDRNTPLELLMAFAKDVSLPVAQRIRAAGLAAQYVHAKRGEGGKKEAMESAAKAAGAGRFAPKQPPKLVVSNS